MAERTNPHAEIIVGAQDQATPTFDKIKGSAQSMAQGVEQSAKKASDSVGKIGDNATPAAVKVDNATKSIIQSIERATAVAKAGEKGTASYFDALAKQRGVSGDVLKPYIDGLRQAEAAQRAATLGAKGMEMSAKQTAAALRGVPAQITDIFVSLQGGQAPMTVLLQQGGQLKDMFGGIAPAARALGSAVLGMVNPLTVSLAALAGLAVAYNQGSKEADAYRLALVSTGNATGTTIGQLNAMAASIGGVVGTQGKAAETLALFATQAVAGAASLEKYATAAIAWERASGQAVGEVAKMFASLKDAPLQSVLKLNESMNFLTEATYQQIKSLEEQGKTTEAAKVAQDALANALDARSAEMVNNLGAIERGWIGIKGAIFETWDAIKRIGRNVGPEGQLDAANANIAFLERRLAGATQWERGEIQIQLNAARERVSALEAQAAANALNASIEKDRATSVQARAEADKNALKYLSVEEKMTRQIAAERAVIERAYTGKTSAEDKAKMAAEIEASEKNIRASYEKTAKVARGARASMAGANPFAAEQDAAKEWAKVLQEAERGIESVENKTAGLNAAQAALLGYISSPAYATNTEEMRQSALARLYAWDAAIKHADGIKEEQAAAEAASKAIGAWTDARMKESESLEGQLAARRLEIDALGLTESAVAELTAAKHEQAAAEQEAYAAALESAQLYAGEYSDAYAGAAKDARDRAKQLRELAGLERDKGAKKEAQAAEEAWAKTAEQINSTLTDALMRGFESGKGFAKNFVDTMKNLFSTLVLRPIISAVVSPVAGAITGALGLAGTANAGTSALGTVGNIASGAKLLGGLGTFGGGLSAGFGGLMGSLGLNATGATLGGAMSAGSIAMGSGNILGGLGTFVGALGPIALGLGALVSLLGKKSTPHVGGGASYGADMGLITGAASNDFIREWTIPESAYRDEANKAAATMAKTISQTLDGVAKQFGQQMGYVVGTGFADDSSKDGAWGALRIALGDRTVADWGNPDDKWAGVTFADGEAGAKEYAAKIASTVREVLNGMDLPGWASRIAESMPADGTMDDLTQVLATISAYPAQLLQQFGTSRDALVQQFAQGLATGDATAAGQSVADSLVQSVQNAVYTNAAGQLFDIVNQGIVTPVLDAMANGAALSEALSEATIQGTIDRAKEQAQKLAELYGNEEFRSVLDTLRTTVGSALGGAGGYIQALPNTLAAAQSIDSAAQSAEQSAKDAAKAWEDINKALASDRLDADIALLRAMGQEEVALKKERERAIEGYDAQQIAMYDGTQAILNQVTALEKQAEAAKIAQERAEELAATLAGELPGVIDKFLNPQQRTDAAYARIAGDLGAAGINIGADALAGASKDQIAAAVVQLYNLGTTSDETRLALIRAASGLADLKDAAEAAAEAAREEARRRREAAQGIVDGSRGGLDNLIKSLTEGALKASGGAIGRLSVTGAEYEQFQGFAQQLDGATQALKELEKLNLGDEFQKYADQIGAIVRESETLLASQLASARILQGNATGALAALGAVGNLSYDGSAADYNAARARLDADNALRLYAQASADALAVSGIDGVLGTLQITLADPQLWQPAAQAITQGIVQASGDVGFAVRDAVAGAAEVLARQGLTSVSGPGIAGVHAAQAKLDFASVGGWARGSWQMGEDVVAYGQALDRLDGMLKTGKLSAQEHADAIGALNTAMGGAAALLGDTAAQAERLAAAQQALGDAGLQSIGYYFDWYGRESDRLAEAARQAGTALGQTTDAIGRLKSASSVFGQSASAAASWEDYAGLSSVSKSRLVADSARTAAAAMTTADAERAAAALAKTGVFASAASRTLAKTGVFTDVRDAALMFDGVSTSVRDAALMLDGIGQYDSKGFEDAFTRIGAALGRGQISEAQYTALFDTALEMYRTGTTAAAEASRNLASDFERLRDVMGDFADGLLIGDKTTLGASQTLAEIQRQYATAFGASAQGDTEAMGKYTELAGLLLDKDRYSTQAEYNAVFGRVYGDARELEARGVSVLANSQNGVVSELRAMNASLNKRVEELEKNLVAALAQIAKNTSDTNKGVRQQTVIIEEQGA